MQATLNEEIVFCTICKNQMNWQTLSKHQKQQYKKVKRIYCSKECSKEYCRNISSMTMAKTNKKYASDRMKTNNPMSNPKARGKMAETLKRMGHKPKIRGGNGELTVPQIALLEALNGLNPVAEFAVATKLRSEEYPDCYKIDIALPEKKIAIEVDGRSHCSLKVKEADKRKTELLEQLGWKVLRFWNKEVMSDLQKCVGMVMSII
jgi:hypothetical protein